MKTIYAILAMILLMGCATHKPITGNELKAVLSGYSKDVRHVYESRQYNLISKESVLSFMRDANSDKVYDAKDFNCRHFAYSARYGIYKYRPKAAVGILKLKNTKSGVLQDGGQGVRMDNHLMIWFIDLKYQLNFVEPQRYWWKPVVGDRLNSFKPVLYFTK